jgi:hypothetical protein
VTRDRTETQRLMEDALLAIGGFLWLGNNLHNIKASPDEFRQMYESAVEDAQPVYDRLGTLTVGDRYGDEDDE